MEKLKVLGIAPYKSLALLLQQAAAKRNDMKLTVYVGDLREGAEIASQYTQNDYDFIISRGGTAEFIRQVSPIPVVEIEVSLHDLLRCMQLAQNASNHYALIGFPNITQSSKFISTIMEIPMDIFTIHSQKEADDILKTINPVDYDVILSDSISNFLAKSYNFHTILITSGIESIESTLNQVAFYGNIYKQTLHQSKIYRALLNTHPFDIYAFSPSGQLVFHSREDLYSEELANILIELVPTVINDGEKKVYRKYSGLLASIAGSHKIIDGESIVQFYVNLRKVPLSLMKNGLQYKSKEEILNNTDNFYINIIPKQFLDNLLKDISNINMPIFVLAENGMEKQAFVEALYLQSSDRNNPLTLIDCSRLSSNKNWEYLMEDMNSPLSDTRTTIYIKNIDILTEQRFRQLLSAINDTRLYKRNRIVFELSHTIDSPYPDRYIFIQNYFNCITIEIPPLRRSQELIPQMAALIISTFNAEYGKEIAGFESEAIRLLQKFDWPSNYKQFRRIIIELGNRTDTPFIKAVDVKIALQNEAKKLSSNKSVPEIPVKAIGLDLKKSLNEINKDIIQIVLNEEGGNQSAAARKLGISRTTLWRILK